MTVVSPDPAWHVRPWEPLPTRSAGPLVTVQEDDAADVEPQDGGAAGRLAPAGGARAT